MWWAPPLLVRLLPSGIISDGTRRFARCKVWTMRGYNRPPFGLPWGVPRRRSAQARDELGERVHEVRDVLRRDAAVDRSALRIEDLHELGVQDDAAIGEAHQDA